MVCRPRKSVFEIEHEIIVKICGDRNNQQIRLCLKLGHSPCEMGVVTAEAWTVTARKAENTKREAQVCMISKPLGNSVSRCAPFKQGRRECGIALVTGNDVHKIEMGYQSFVVYTPFSLSMLITVLRRRTWGSKMHVPLPNLVSRLHKISECGTAGRLDGRILGLLRSGC